MNQPVTTAPPALPVRPIVSLDYRVRVVGHLVIMVTLSSILPVRVERRKRSVPVEVERRGAEA